MHQKRWVFLAGSGWILKVITTTNQASARDVSSTGTSTTSTATQAATGNQAMATTTGPFLDFMVTFVALVMILMTHKFIRSFLDSIIPTGSGGGPATLMSGLMEGVGIGIGSQAVGAGMGIAKAGAGLGASAGIAGLAGARSFLKGKESLKTPLSLGGGGGSPIENATPLRLPSPNGQTEGKGWTMTDPTFLGGAKGLGVGNFSFGASGEPMLSAERESTAQGSSMFDSASVPGMGSAYTQMMPSAKDKLASLQNKPQYKSATGAFFSEASRKLKQDVRHKATHRGGGYDGAQNLMGVAMNEFGDRGAERKLQHDQSLPSSELMKAAAYGGPESDAAQDLVQIGQHQRMMDKGMEWITEGDNEQQAILPAYEAARSNYELAERDVNLLGANLAQARDAGMEGTPQLVQAQAAYEQAVQRRDVAKAQYLPVQARMERAQTLSERGTRHVAQAQNAISQINWKYYTPSESMMRQAQLAATTRGLSQARGGKR